MWQREKRRILLLPRILVRLQPPTTVCAQRLQVGCQPRPPSSEHTSASANYPSTDTKRSLSADVCSCHELLLSSWLPLGLRHVSPHDAFASVRWLHSCAAARTSRIATQMLPPNPAQFPESMCLRHSSTSANEEAGPYAFKTLGIAPELQERLKDLDMLRALPVQAAAVPAILGGRNVAIKSCTGSGKTLAYGLPVIQLSLSRRRAAEEAHRTSSETDAGSGESDVQAGFRRAALKHRTRCLQALIVAPSRELCIQIQRTAQELLPAPVDRRHIVQLIGGANRTRQEAALAGRDGGVWPLVAVGTPGRVAEFVASGKLPVWNCPMLVLDEVDQLLEQDDLRKHIDDICDHVGRRADATLPRPSSTGAVSTTPLPPNTPKPPSMKPPVGPTHGAGTAPTASRGPGSGKASGSGSGRQTVIVSASLDARDPDRFSDWCPNPLWIVLGSRQALPPEFLQLPNALSKASQKEAPKPQGTTAAGLKAEGLEMAVGRDSRSSGQEGASEGASTTQEERTREMAGVGSLGGGGGSGKEAIEAATRGAAAARVPVPDGDPPTSQPEEADDGCQAAGPLVGVLPPHLAHVYTLTPAEHRTDRVRRLIHALGAERALLFVAKQNQAMVTKFKLEARNMQVTILHGRLTKMERGNILDAFRRGVFRALVVTDLGARGLDLPDCDAVINFGPPADALVYAHRAGRTGRAGAAGVVATVVTLKEMKLLNKITRKLGVTLQGIALSEGNIAPLEDAMKKPSTARDVAK